MGQLVVNSRMPGLQRGMLFGDRNEIVSRFNNRSEVRTLTLTYDAAGAYSVTITGIAFDGGPSQSVTIGPIAQTVDANTTTQAVLAAIQANILANSIVSTVRATNVITATARRAGGLTVATSASGGAAAFVTATTSSEEPMEAGVAIAQDTAGDKQIRKMFAAVGQVSLLTLTQTNSVLYTVGLRLFDVDGTLLGTYVLDYTSDGTATFAEIQAGFVARAAAIGCPITPSANGNNINLTAPAGMSFEVVETSGDIVATTPTAAVSPVFDGITLWPKVQDNSQALGGNNVWPAKFDVSVLRKGHIGVYCDGAVTPQSQVFVRFVANGTNSVLGAFRADSDTNTAMRVRRGKFLTTAAAGAVAQFDLNML